MDKLVTAALDAVRDIPDRSRIAVGGFGMCGVPTTLIDALIEVGATDLEIVSNNCGIDGAGLGLLLEAGRVRRVVSSYVGENKYFGTQYLSGDLEVELTPQGSLAERLRAAGAGIPAFYTPAGVGTPVADGGLPWRYGRDGSVAVASPRKEIRDFGGHSYILEEALNCDVALIRAARGDRHGNLSYAAAAGNFNALCAAAARVTIVEVEELLEPGTVPPEHVHTPGIFVNRIVRADERPKVIEKLTTRDEGRSTAPDDLDS